MTKSLGTLVKLELLVQQLWLGPVILLGRILSRDVEGKGREGKRGKVPAHNL